MAIWRMRAKVKGGGERIRLKPHDSFDLIHLIARSQSDPRKAIAELVQNSLDAGASRIKLTWFSLDKRRALSVWDDGRGIFPDLERPEALRRIATTIGASHKAQLSPRERHVQMTLGKYGIGLLGFWSVGHRLEIRTRVSGSDAWSLRLEEEGRDGSVERLRASRLPLEETFTEAVITQVHAAVESQLRPRRLAAYLAGEMRGQLLAREVRLEIHDRVGRGLAEKLLVVRPQRFQGVLLEALTELAVPGFATARVELYLVPESQARRACVSLACGGATVLDDIALIDGGDEPRAPWDSGRFEGVVDFPDLHVAPSTRRGFVPNEAARALVAALPVIEEALREILARDEARADEERSEDDAKDLRRLFRPLARLLPQYAFFEVRDAAPAAPAGNAPEGEAMPEAGVAPGVSAEADAEARDDEPQGEPMLFPPGPLARVDIRPRRSVLLPESTRTLRATARDADGRRLVEPVSFEWALEGPGRVEPDGGACAYRAPLEPGRARVTVVARQGESEAEAAASLVVSDDAEPDRGQRSGIPDPEPFHAPGEPWRSRVDAATWQYNVAHPDYLLVAGDDRRRLRHLAHLFAKEVVLVNFRDDPPASLLERMVEVLTRLDESARRGK